MWHTKKGTTEEKKYFCWKDKILGWSVEIVLIVALLSAFVWISIRTVRYVMADHFWR
jgi:hypothetical protein